MQILIYSLILPSSGIEYDPRSVDQDKLSTYPSLDDYDTLFEARHGRGAIDSVTISGERVPAASPVVDTHFDHKHGCDQKYYDWGKIKTHT